MLSITNYLTNPYCNTRIKQASLKSAVCVPTLKAVLVAAFGQSSKDGMYTNIGQQKIADKLCVCRGTVIKAINALRSVDLITTTKRYIERTDGLLRRTTNRMFFKAYADFIEWRDRNRRSAKNAVNIIAAKCESFSSTISSFCKQQVNIPKEHPALRGSTALNIDLRTGEILNFPSTE